MAQIGTRNSLDKIAVLRQTNLFFNLPDPILRTISACSIARHLKRGEVLYYQHDEASALYVVCSGELRSIRQNTDGREQVLSMERAGAILAAVCICDGGQCHSTVTADTPSEILSIEKRDIQDLCRKHSDLVWNLAGVLARQVRDSAELIEALALRDVDQRVAQYVLTACKQRGISEHAAFVFELTTTRSEIARCVGSAREVVSRSFAHLQRAGLIQIQGRRLVTIPNIRALTSFADAEPSPKPASLVSVPSSEVA